MLAMAARSADEVVTSANVACGGHAGDEDMMQATIEQPCGVRCGGRASGYEGR